MLAASLGDGGDGGVVLWKKCQYNVFSLSGGENLYLPMFLILLLVSFVVYLFNRICWLDIHWLSDQVEFDSVNAPSP